MDALRAGKTPKKNKIWVVDAATGRTVASFSTDYTYCGCLAISPDGKHVFVNAGHWLDKPLRWVGGIEVWNLPRGIKMHQFEGGIGSGRMTVSADGKYLFCGGRKSNGVTGMVQMWDIATGKALWQSEEHVCNLYVVTFSPNGKHVMSAGDSPFLRIRDLRTGRLVQSLQVADIKRDGFCQKSILSAVFDRTGRQVFAVSGWENERPVVEDAKLWNLESGLAVAKLAVGPQYVLPDGDRGFRVDSAPSGGPGLTEI